MNKLFLILALGGVMAVYADGRNQGAINNLCQNLSGACAGGDSGSCQAYKDTGCMCVESQGTCTRGNYSN